MTRFEKIYEHSHYYDSMKCSIPKYNRMNMQGYGCIKRRKGLLSYEVNGPTYHPDINLSEDQKSELKSRWRKIFYFSNQ